MPADKTRNYSSNAAIRAYRGFTAGILLFAVGVFFACGKTGQNETKNPPGILSEEVFINVLADFALAESAATMNIKNVNMQKADSVYAFDPLSKNNVSKAEYDSTVSFYVKQPELYKKIYENVLVKLSEMQAQRNGNVKNPDSK